MQGRRLFGSMQFLGAAIARVHNDPDPDGCRARIMSWTSLPYSFETCSDSHAHSPEFNRSYR